MYAHGAFNCAYQRFNTVDIKEHVQIQALQLAYMNAKADMAAEQRQRQAKVWLYKSYHEE